MLVNEAEPQEGAAGVDPLDAAIEAAKADLAGKAGAQDAPEAGEPADKPEEGEVEPDLPQHWSEEERGKWATVPAEHRKLLVDARKSIEAGFNTKSQKLSDKERYWKEIKRAFGPLQPLLGQSGTTKLQAIRNLVNAEVALRSQPDAAFEHLARSFAASRSDAERQAILNRFSRGLGIQAGAAVKPQAEPEWLDPVAGQKIARLETALAQLTQGMTQQMASAKQTAIAQAEQLIQNFKKDPAHPHYDAVAADIEILLASPRVPAHLPAVERLTKAYEMACRLNPEVWEKIEAAKRAEKAKADAAKRQEEVNRSKPAARNPQGQFVSTTQKAKQSLDDIVREAMTAA